MNFNITTIIFSFLFILSFNGVLSINSNAPLTRYQIWIANDLSNALFLHCWSKSNDLGTHFINYGDGFHWHFRENLWQSTKYKCEFVWNTKTITFNVFDRGLSGKCRGRGDICYWLVTENGFYFANYLNPFPSDLKFMYSW
ncbi:hypothetical protein RND71_014644 [Anisodus tanguticus]|uniref:S-protein homolog n=1 Tax=Anisodus tanguticus TaxID=243964 RepID=A0AAE1S9I1_9SOLA|nr:hypothetical protein RND71_014644 [Anisodus tanguticus]